MNGIPAPEYGKNDQETIQNLMDSVAKMRKELNFLLHHLDDENIPTLPIAKADIKANRTSIEENEESIRLLAIDVAGNTATITIQAGQIQSLVSDVAGNTSSITQLSNEITLKVDVGDYTASVVIGMINGSSGVQINADKIELNGITHVNKYLRVGESMEYGEITLGPGGAIIRAENDVGGPKLYLSSSSMEISASYINFYGNIDFSWCNSIGWGPHQPALSTQGLSIQDYNGHLEVYQGSTLIGKLAYV